MSTCCDHCGAKRSNLHTFTEKAGMFGTFDVVRCLLCGWQLCRLKPWKRRGLPEAEELIFGEEDELTIRFANFASKAPLALASHIGPRY